MQVVFMRQGQIWNYAPSLREPIFCFERVAGRDAALAFLCGGPSDPLPTLVGVVDDDVILGEWLEAGAEVGFQKLWECTGTGLEKWKRAKLLKDAYGNSAAIRECVSTPLGKSSKKLRL